MFKQFVILLSIPILLFSGNQQNHSLCSEIRGADDYEYLIATTDALKNSYDAFIEFNKRRCLRTEIQTIEYIKSNVSGNDDAEKLRNYIKDQYDNKHIVFVLLGGDADSLSANIVPYRGLSARIPDQTGLVNLHRDIPADMYFSCLDSTGDPFSDFSWEVYAARFPVDNESELQNMINKTIKYSEEPVTGETMNNLLVGEFLWHSGIEVWGADHLLEYMGTCTTNSYETVGFPESWNTTELFDKDAPVEWTADDLINAIRDNKVAWIDQIGHTNYTYFARMTSSKINDTLFKVNDGINANYFMLSSQSCYIGAFDNKKGEGQSTNHDDCWAEKILTLPNGPVAFHGNPRVSFGDEFGTDGADQRLIRYFHDALFNKKLHHLEMMNANSKEVNAALITQLPPVDSGQLRFCMYQKNILGDPALSIWTEEPKELQADYPSPLTTTLFKWDTKKPYTWIALLADDSIICTQLTDSSGTCKIEDEDLAEYVKANPSGTLKVRVKAHNYLPFEGELPINYSTSINSNNVISSLTSNFAFGNKLRIIYTVPYRGYTNISIYNSKGTLITTIVNGMQDKGKHSIGFDISNLSSGIYYITLCLTKNSLIKKMVVMR